MTDEIATYQLCGACHNVKVDLASPPDGFSVNGDSVTEGTNEDIDRNGVLDENDLQFVDLDGDGVADLTPGSPSAISTARTSCSTSCCRPRSTNGRTTSSPTSSNRATRVADATCPGSAGPDGERRAGRPLAAGSPAALARVRRRRLRPGTGSLRGARRRGGRSDRGCPGSAARDRLISAAVTLDARGGAGRRADPDCRGHGPHERHRPRLPDRVRLRAPVVAQGHGGRRRTATPVCLSPVDPGHRTGRPAGGIASPCSSGSAQHAPGRAGDL